MDQHRPRTTQRQSPTKSPPSSPDNTFRYQVQALVLLYITRGDTGERLLSRNEVRRNVANWFGVELDEPDVVHLPELPIADPMMQWDDELTEVN